MIFWLSRCPTCGSVFREHQCLGKQWPAPPPFTYTQLSLFKDQLEERDED